MHSVLLPASGSRDDERDRGLGGQQIRLPEGRRDDQGETQEENMWIDVITQPGPTFRFDPARGYLPLLEDRPTIAIPQAAATS